METNKRFLLVHPEISRTKYNFAGVIDNEPLELEYLYTLLNQKGFEPDIWDGQVETSPLTEKLKAFQPQYVYICGRTRQVNFIREYCAATKALCGSTVFVGGLHAQHNYHHFYIEAADYILKTFDIYKILSVLEGESLSDIDGLCYREGQMWKENLLISIGGGSAIDTAKAVKYALLEQPQYQKLAHIAIPTTAGSGSEATHFAVIYQDGEKVSLDHPALLSEYCILDSTLLYSMTAQQRKVSLLDAFCHSIESFLSCHATVESNAYAASALHTLTAYWEPFVNGDPSVFDAVLAGANDAGRAINLTKTTFAHAMSYILTSQYGIRHGQAAAICLIHGLRYAEQNQLQPNALAVVKHAFGCKENELVSEKMASIYCKMQVEEHFHLEGNDCAALVMGVNAQRLSNSVIPFAETDLLAVYMELARQYS